MTAELVNDECDILRALIKDPTVWDSAQMLAGVERLRAQLLLSLGEAVCPPMPTPMKELTRSALWG